jgi:hypothetical protein
VTNIQGFDEIYQKYNFTNEDIKIYLLAKQYEYIARGNKQFVTLFKKDEDPRTARFWNAFKKCYNEVLKGRNIDSSVYFAAQFRTDTKKYIPNYLSTKSSYIAYKKYLALYKQEQIMDEISEREKCQQLYKTKRFINKWLIDNEYPEDSYKAFFEYKENFDDEMPYCYRFVSNYTVSRLFLVISKSFGEVYKELAPDIQNEFLTPDEKKRYKLIMINNQTVLNFAHHTLGNEVDLGW